MIKIEQLNPKELSNDDVSLIERGCAGSYDKANAGDQIAAATGGNAWIFRFFRDDGTVKGIFVLSRGNVAEREVIMTALAGKGLISNFPEVYSEVKKLCKSVHAKRLIGYVSRPGLASIYRKRTKAIPVATLFSENLDV